MRTKINNSITYYDDLIKMLEYNEDEHQAKLCQWSLLDSNY